MIRRLDRACLLAACVALPQTGCGRATDIMPGDIRTYTVARPAGGELTAGPRPPAAASALRYRVPDGWVDRGASGMRLATLAIGDPADGLEVTVIPAAGTLRSNVERWHGQLASAATAEDKATAVDRALAAAETIDVDGTAATLVALFDATSAADSAAPGEAILGAMIPVDEASSLFVKFKGDAAVARRERDAFRGFVSSLRWK